jgi:restriction endonuclease Mrr
MEVVLEILKYILPAGIVFVGVYFIMNNFFENEQRKTSLRLRNDDRKQVLPIRLQAYERIILYLERINLSNMVMRLHNNKMSAMDMQRQMLATIRSEYEHNMAQQLYISSKAWKVVVTAKEENIKVINSCAEQLGKDSSGMDLSRFILEVVGKSENTPTDVAIEAIKREISYLF